MGWFLYFSCYILAYCLWYNYLHFFNPFSHTLSPTTLNSFNNHVNNDSSSLLFKPPPSFSADPTSSSTNMLPKCSFHHSFTTVWLVSCPSYLCVQHPPLTQDKRQLMQWDPWATRCCSASAAWTWGCTTSWWGFHLTRRNGDCCLRVEDW